jgi:Tol biopolymer transport system component
MKRLTSILLLVLAILFSFGIATAQQNKAEKLYQEGLHQMEGIGDYSKAIELFNRVVTEFPKDKPVAAKALLQMGRCYEKLGRDEARKAYERLLRDYADQSEQAKLARARLAALRAPASASKEPTFATRQVWTTPDIGNVEGAPSPDGKFLSFTDWETGDLAIRDLENGTNRRLTNKGPWEKSEEFAMFSRWSPDGKQIAYDWYDGKCCTDLHVIAREGGKSQTLVDYQNDEWMQTYDWSPDGKQILIFLEKKDGTRQIVLVSATDGTTKVVKTFERRGRLPQVMRFSHDGQFIAYDQPQEENAPEHDIFLISADGSNEVPLVKHPAHDLLLGWPPDRKGILFASDRTGSMDMWFLPVSGGKAEGAPELVKRGVEEIVPLGFTQGGSFYYAQGQGAFDVYVARMDRESGKILAPPEKAIKRFEGANSWPAYSRDGKSLAYITTRRRSFQAAAFPNILCIRSLETDKDREFTTKFRRLADPSWSPDGQFVYLAAWDNQGMGIYRVNTQNGEFTPIVRTEFPARLRRHEVSPDGNILVYERLDHPKPPYRILSRNLTTGEEKQIYAGDQAMFSISPDGRWLALINQDKKKVLRVMPASGGEPKELLRFEEERSYFSSIEWTPDGKYILFPRVHPTKDQPKFALWRIAAEGGEPQELNLVMAYFQDFSAHPDGQHLAFDSPGLTLKSPAVWVMENFLPPAPARPSATTLTARRLENPPEDAPSGAVSPDGRYLSFFDWQTGDLAVRDLQTGKDRRLTNEGTEGQENPTVSQQAYESTWSPDGKSIAYAWYIGSDAQLRVELRVVGLDGGKPRVLSQFDSVRELWGFTWSPDGKHIVASVYPKNGLKQMALISTTDGSTRVLTDIKREISATTKCFSPDSRYVAYDALPDDTSPERDIFLMSIDSGQVNPLIQHPADDYLLGWSRDGKWIAFASDRTGALGLWVVGVAGGKTQGEPQLVRPGIDRILPIGLTREGALYYGVVRATEDVYIADLDPETGKVSGSPRRAIERYEGGNFSPSYSRDGKYLAYVSRRGNSPYPTNVGNALCIRSLDTGQERVFYREIWRLGLRWIGGPRWSPDGRFITFGGSEGVWITGVYRVDLETGEITRILRCGPDEELMSGAFGPNGKFFHARGNTKEGFSQIVVQDLETGDERELYRFPTLERGIRIALSPDGRWLSFINAGSGAVRSLKIMPASGGDTREVWSFGETKRGTPGAIHTWSPDGRYIVFSTPDPSDLPVWDLWRIPVEGGKPEKMGLQKKWGILDLTIHPDGRRLAFANRGGSSMDSEVWVMENFLPKENKAEK